MLAGQVVSLGRNSVALDSAREMGTDVSIALNQDLGPALAIAADGYDDVLDYLGGEPAVRALTALADRGIDPGPSYPRSRIAMGGGELQFGEEVADAAFDFVADGAYAFDVESGWVVEVVPVFVALAGEDGAGVAAAHADHHVGGPDDLVGPGFGELVGDVDAALGHRGDGGRG